MEGSSDVNEGGETQTTTWAAVARRIFPHIVIDLVENRGEERRRMDNSLIADIVFDHLGLKREEFFKFRRYNEEEGKWTLKILTTKDINVKARFVGFEHFNVSPGWRAKIRGMQERVERPQTLKIRLLNPPDEIPLSEIESELEKHVQIRSGVKEETVSASDEPRLAGILNGHAIARIIRPASPSAIPRWIGVRNKKIQVRIVVPSGVCFKCLTEGHRARDCQEQMERNDDLELTVNYQEAKQEDGTTKGTDEDEEKRVEKLRQKEDEKSAETGNEKEKECEQNDRYQKNTGEDEAGGAVLADVAGKDGDPRATKGAKQKQRQLRNRDSKASTSK